MPLFAAILLALFQMAWIPGRILLGIAPLRFDSRLQRLAYIFALSLLANYLLVFLLTLLGLYQPPAVFAWLALEALLLALVWRRGAGGVPRRPLAEWLAAARRYLAGHTTAHNLLLGAALLSLGALAGCALARLEAVFVASDAALSWNRWALHWAANRLPTTTSLYPQLLPANWSLAYQIMGTCDIAFVPRNLAVLFPAATVLLFVDLGRRLRDAAYFLAGALYTAIIFFLFGCELVSEGMTDLPVAFFTTLAIYVLHRRQPASGRTPFHAPSSLLALLFACAAAVTKQAGLLAVAVVLAWSLFQAVRDRAVLGRGARLRFAAAAFFLVALVAGSWYGNRLWLVSQHRERTMIREVTQQVHHGRDYGQRLEHGFTRLFTGYGPGRPQWGWAAAAGLLLAASLFRRRARLLTALVVLPFTLAWGLFYSYDCRNLTVVLPLAALALAMGVRSLQRAAAWLHSRLPRRPVPTAAWAGLLLLAAAAAPLTWFDGEAVRRDQLAQLRRQGELPLNTWLYRFYRRHGFAGKVFSSYNYFRVLPELRDHLAAERDGADVYYLLENYRRRRQDLLRDIRLKVRSGEYALLFAYKEWRFIQIRGTPPFRLTPDGQPPGGETP